MTKLWRRLQFLVRRKRFESDLEDEIRVHLEMKAEAGGGTEDARYAAQRQFGNTLLPRGRPAAICGDGGQSKN